MAIANRGEVALRILKACQALQIPTVLLHSQADIKTIAFRLAHETICIGDSPPSESYLNIDAHLKAVCKAKADALHPGFGFLSENAQFAKAIEDAGVTFIGPSHKAIADMGDKMIARKIMSDAGVPVIPGDQGSLQTDEYLKNAASKIGFPVLIKAALGGGGRGIKIARSQDDFLEQLNSARRESLAAFGSDKVFLEKYIEKARHIEFQIFGDRHGQVTHLFERDCSIQRRHQKIIEESPALIPHKIHAEMAQATIKAAQAVNYVGAGTVEFLLDGQDWWFLEMNTRLQVEHPVTEMLLDVDLVKAQIQVAAGQKLPFHSSHLKPLGHVMECRIYAEDPYREGLPSTGVIFQKWSTKENRRFEYGLDDGDEVSPFYDPMLAKIIVKAKDRISCIEEMKAAIKESYVFGVKTNFDYLKSILEHPVFVKGAVTTDFISKYFDKGLEPRTKKDFSKWQLAFQNHAKQFVHKKNRISHQNAISIFKKSYAEQWQKPKFQIESLDMTFDGQEHKGFIGFDPLHLWMHFRGAIWTEQDTFFSDDLLQENLTEQSVVAHTPGKVLKVMVKEGDQVKVGENLLALEAMKMEYLIKSNIDGQVKQVHVKTGQQVKKEQMLFSLALVHFH